MADAKVDNKETTTPSEEVTSTEPAKESLKKAPVVETEANGVGEHENGDADTPAENGDAEEDADAEENGTSENGENGANGDASEEKTESGVKRKSHSGEGDTADVTTPEKKSKTAEEPPAEEAAA